MNDVEIKKAWEYRGRKCVILWVRNHFCGYGETHQKISYLTSPDGTEENAPIWYFGIDFAHIGDHIEFTDMNCKSKRDCHKWTLEEVEKEVETMVDSIIEYDERLKNEN